MRTPILDIEELERVLVPKLRESPKTFDEIMKTLRVSRRTVHRYLELLETAGYRVSRVGLSRPTRYQIM